MHNETSENRAFVQSACTGVHGLCMNHRAVSACACSAPPFRVHARSLTVHTEDTRHFTEESESYAKKRCLTEPIAGAAYIYQSFHRELVYVFGQEWYDTLVARAAQHPRRLAQGEGCEDRTRLQWHQP